MNVARTMLVVLTASVAVLSGTAPHAPAALAAGPGGSAPILDAGDVAALLRAAATSLDDPGLAVAVTDRAGTILGVWARPQAAPTAPDVAVSLARTTAFFSNDQAPLSSRTVRFLSGIHFPPGVTDAPNAALYGVENINRGCTLDVLGDAIFNEPIVRPRSLTGTLGPDPLPCEPSDTRGCAVAGPILGPGGAPIFSLGISTGKADLLDTDNGAESTIDPGGVPIYRGAQLIGGIGVTGTRSERAEYAALVGILGAGNALTTAIDLPNPLPPPGAIYIEGVRLPFVRATGDPPAGSAPGSFEDGRLIVAPRDGRQAPEGWLIGPRGSLREGGLDTQDVVRIVEQAVAQAKRTRAQVRLPYGEYPRFIMAVTDEDGRILGEYRQEDALFDAVDVVPSKARNAYYFSTPEGYEVLRGYAERAGYAWEPSPPEGAWALTNRTIGYGGQPYFPPGLDGDGDNLRGPWFDLFVYDTLNPCTEGPGPSRGPDRGFLNQNGITWFAGSVPLYKNGRLVGGWGVSGDGVEQNDLVTAAGAQGYEPQDALRVDNSSIRTPKGLVRLPYLKFPRNPEERP